MQVEELDMLRNHAGNVLGCKVRIIADFDGTWWVQASIANEHDKSGISFAEAVERLRKMATPQKPATVTITIPTVAAEHLAARRRQAWAEWDGPMSNVAEACAEAVAPYQPPK